MARGSGNGSNGAAGAKGKGSKENDKTMEKDTLAKTNKGRKAGIKQSMSEDYLWPVSLYLHDKLDAESLTALRANHDKVSKSDTNGDLLVRVLYLLEQKSMADRATLLEGQRR
ncbi:predicted protein [Aspergillus nidulans FGSC A4]|uniref:Uncharacterized protein n=1 Tax=Emericella nidulans (strain FGSC A4 / ATCC 38163 / CBS 112.46 / NRRL 194 / M139) TaxID=227321 RepID=Q5AXA0_EMENI|nr:hypothetical protein [Aspergillus nidulans FGSC A4]EAA61209.1 predicted protein [Aspergillus nidulans FGSC A4]CBF79124.1 TPA: hypothetical protein ANIA_07080 [Aspergillus nidulans FGSC A4]|eukprot:XP_664684.1 predicted protein [Aspergillus nidulans FGSC A4]